MLLKKDEKKRLFEPDKRTERERERERDTQNISANRQRLTGGSQRRSIDDTNGPPFDLIQEGNVR